MRSTRGTRTAHRARPPGPAPGRFRRLDRSIHRSSRRMLPAASHRARPPRAPHVAAGQQGQRLGTLCGSHGSLWRPVGRLSPLMQKTGPAHRMCRRVGAPLCGRPNCPSNKRPYPPGQHGRGRKRFSEYQVRLLEKQKLRAIYGVNEAQMRRYYDKASRSRGVTGEELILQLETRLDAVVLRLGFALTMRQARQLVSHGHVLLDGRRVNVPERPGQGRAPRSRSRARRRTSSPSARRSRSPPEPPIVPVPEQGPAAGHALARARARRDPPAGRGRRAAHHRVLLLALSLHLFDGTVAVSSRWTFRTFPEFGAPGILGT